MLGTRRRVGLAVVLAVGVLVATVAVVVLQDRSEPAGDDVAESVGAGAAADDELRASGDGSQDERTEEDRTEQEARDLLLVVGDPELTDPEQEMRTALEELRFDVTIMDDADSRAEDADGRDVVLISKTVQSAEVADEFLMTRTGVVFWEDNAQAIEQDGDRPGEGTRGLATIDAGDLEDTAWHAASARVFINPDAPEELRAGLSGSVDFYTEPAEMTFAPKDDDDPTVASSATWVAEFGEEGNGRYVYYVIEADAGLADGTGSHGRRAYFGLYDETFPLLTAEGRALFEAAVEWAAAGG